MVIVSKMKNILFTINRTDSDEIMWIQRKAYLIITITSDKNNLSVLDTAMS